MQELQNRKSKLSQISKKLDFNVAEASRHLQRLSEDKLIQKEPNGLYGLTPFGAIVLYLLADLSFVSKHREYFLEYNASGIPNELLDRIGELEKGEYMAETLTNLEEGEEKIREAREHVWILSDQIMTRSIPALAEKTKGPFDLRIILPEGKFPPESKSQLPSKVPSIQKRVLPKADAVVVMTEKYAVFCLPNRSGKIDYTGFKGTDPKFLKWCKDLFLYYWEQAKPFANAQAH